MAEKCCASCGWWTRGDRRQYDGSPDVWGVCAVFPGPAKYLSSGPIDTRADQGSTCPVWKDVADA